MTQKACVTAVIEVPAAYHEQGRRILSAIAVKARQDEGCLRFVAYGDKTREGIFTLNEEWADEASLQAHLESAHVQATFAALEEISARIENWWSVQL